MPGFALVLHPVSYDYVTFRSGAAAVLGGRSGGPRPAFVAPIRFMKI